MITITRNHDFGERVMFVDIDSTFWPAEKEYVAAEKQLFGTTHLAERYFSVPELKVQYGEDYTKIFDVALDPKKCMQRVPYEGVENALMELHFAMGFDIHFISYNHDPEAMIKPLTEWIDSRFIGITAYSSDVTVLTQEYNKIDVMNDYPKAFGIIEDATPALLDAAKAGYRSYAFLQPWNEEVVHRHKKLITPFSRWNQIPEIVALDLTIDAKLGKIKAVI